MDCNKICPTGGPDKGLEKEKGLRMKVEGKMSVRKITKLGELLALDYQGGWLFF